MARQPKTAKPKTKFEKRYKCGRCHRPTNEFFLGTIAGETHVVCKGGCRPKEG